MEICFYNVNHIGDVYFSSFFINLICKQNSDINFLYYFINGDIFFKNVSNINRIDSIENNYNNTLVNGNPPEDLLNKNILSLLLNNKMEKTGTRILNINGKNILFVNTWCKSEYFQDDDFEIYGAFKSYKNLINHINSNYNFIIKFNIEENGKQILDNIYKYDTVLNTIELDYKKTIFIFNYKPRSIIFDLNLFNKLIHYLSINNNIILSCYDSNFNNNKNIKFIDRDFNIYPQPTCENLLNLWEIAIKCEKVIITPSGSSWTFFHKLHMIKENQIFIINNINYQKNLNNIINYFTGESSKIGLIRF
jgi:hypothetical protein